MNRSYTNNTNRSRTYRTHGYTPSSSVRRLRKRQEEKKNKRRMYCLAFFIVIASVITLILSTAANANKIADTEICYVSNGDTLWSIAASCNTQNDDIRDVMDDIMKLNDMKTSQLHIGDKLILPVY